MPGSVSCPSCSHGTKAREGDWWSELYISRSSTMNKAADQNIHAGCSYIKLEIVIPDRIRSRFLLEEVTHLLHTDSVDLLQITNTSRL